MAKTAPKKKAPAPKGAKAKAAKKKPLSKTQVIAVLAEKTELSKKEINGVLDALENLIADNLKPGGPEVFQIPNLVKITKKVVPAKPEREVKKPFTNEIVKKPAEPAKEKIVVKPLKRLKSIFEA
ncbi:MAG TPA: HU family DNA-binding protein [Pirellulales bacterium]